MNAETINNIGGITVPRPQTKADLLSAANTNYEKLMTLIASLSETELATPFDFLNDEKKKEAHWKRDKNLRDVLIHLYEWHQLILNWVNDNQAGIEKSFLPEPYNWKTYGEMNVMFWQKHQDTLLEDAKVMLDESHKQVMVLADQFTSDELFSKDVFDWVGGSTLGSYFVSATSSHYDWAIKKLKAHQRNCKNK